MQTIYNAATVQKQEDVTLKKLSRILWNKLWLLLLVALLSAAIGLAITATLITPTYASFFTAYINNHSDNSVLTSLNSSDVSTRQTLANTAAKIATSDSVVWKVARKAEVDEKEINVITSVDTASSILKISVVMKDREKAYECANILKDTVIEETARIVEGSSVQCIDNPAMPTERYSPNLKKNTIIAGIIGLLIAAIILVLVKLQDDTLEDVEELEKEYAIPLVGSIPNFALGSEDSEYGYHYAYRQR